MSWYRTAVVVTLAMAPTLAAGSAMANQITSSSSGDAAWLATQLNQTHFAKQSSASINDSYDYARSDGSGPARVLPVAQHYRGTNPTGQSRAWCAVCQYGPEAHRVSRHRLGRGGLFRPIWPPGRGSSPRRHRRLAASRRVCRRLERSRTHPCGQRQSQSSGRGKHLFDTQRDGLPLSCRWWRWRW